MFSKLFYLNMMFIFLKITVHYCLLKLISNLGENKQGPSTTNISLTNLHGYFNI